MLIQFQTRDKSRVFVRCIYDKYKFMIYRRVQKVIRVCDMAW
jgi:hypothetical protein